jgi:hypothetical protein
MVPLVKNHEVSSPKMVVAGIVRGWQRARSGAISKNTAAQRPLVFFPSIAVPRCHIVEGACGGAVMKVYIRGKERFLRVGEKSALVAREGG